MAARPTWQGRLRLSLVTCPVALYNATSPAGDVHFNLLNPKPGNGVRLITTDPDTGPVERSSLQRGSAPPARKAPARAPAAPKTARRKPAARRKAG